MLPKTMKAAVVHEFGRPLALEEIPVPTPGPGEVLIKIFASGVCHTDLHAARGDWPVKPGLPFVPGHEGTGIVAAVGAGVKRVKEGDPVGLAWLHDACGGCEHCTTGWETLCESQHNSGYSVNGSFAEYAIGHADYVARLPANPNFVSLAPILCAGVTTYKGVRETEARMLGADVTVNSTEPDAVEAVIRATGGGAHGVVVTAVANSAFNQAIRYTRRRGTVSLVGLPPGSFPTPIFDVVLKRITIRGSIVGTRRDLVEALEFVAERKVIAQTHRARLSDINEVFERLERGDIAGRMVLDIAGGAADQVTGLPASNVIAA